MRPAISYSMQVLTLLVLGLLGLQAGVANAGPLDQGNYTKIEKVAANSTSEEEEASSTQPSFSAFAHFNRTENCQDQIGVVENGVVMNNMPKYDIEQILEGLGGAPGKVNVTRRNDTKEVALSDKQLKERPLPDADEEYWLYDYKTIANSTEMTTFIRREHALLRFRGTEQEFLDIRGEIWWSPPDFCNNMRHATYRLDDTGFHQDVGIKYCWLQGQYLSCASPASCEWKDGTLQCVAAPSSALMASLVGG